LGIGFSGYLTGAAKTTSVFGRNAKCKACGARRAGQAGGVAANKLLRERLQRELHVPAHLPPMALCVDNGR